MTHFEFDAIGTRWAIDILRPLSPRGTSKKNTSVSAGHGVKPRELERSIQDRIEAFDRNYSRFRADSLVTRMSHEAGEYQLPEDAKPLLDLYQQLYKITGGLVTPLIGRTLEEAGYDASYTLKPGALHTPPKWEGILDYDFPRLTMKEPALLDFGAAGKGYLVDIIGDLLSENGVSDFVINAGGDILHHSTHGPAVDVALEHPADLTQAIGVVHLSNKSLCGSSGNRRAWGEFHHIMNPGTLKSPRHILSAWVMADTALLADGLATALFFVQAEALKQHFQYEYALVRSDLSLQHSEGFPGDFFTEDKSEKIA